MVSDYSYASTTSCGSPVEGIPVLFLAVEAVLFGIFTCCLMQDQYDVLETNETQIDRLKNTTGSNRMVRRFFVLPMPMWSLLSYHVILFQIGA